MLGSERELALESVFTVRYVGNAAGMVALFSIEDVRVREEEPREPREEPRATRLGLECELWMDALGSVKEGERMLPMPPREYCEYCQY